MLVAIQGQAGSFHEQVARAWYGSSVDIVPHTTFRQMFDAYANGDVDAIVTAVENTFHGSINTVYQLIEACDAPIVGEAKLAIEHMLITRPGAKLEDITEVYSQDVALSQCQKWLKKHLPHAEQIDFFDTAAAVEFIKEEGDTHMAAIASEQAAKVYDMPILARGVHDSSDNITRFLILEPTDTPADANRASLVVTTSHKPGALVEVLQVFADAGVNLAKLQSQPIIGKPFEYKFFIVVDAAGEPLYKLIEQIEKSDHQVTLLGEYKAA